ncbi:MAG: KUP/HAK/KT family potassium transporter [Chitinivibrionales bacterium]|nr:KUP/HAK/KT family potassium transporter [Chitinivibrionales bacterium]
MQSNSPAAPDLPNKKNPAGFGLAIGALGVVFGDIGTSPLYALRECFSGQNHVALTNQNVCGMVSLVFWTLLIVVCVKYVVFVLRADNKGEGGILALSALVDRIGVKTRRMHGVVLMLGLLGTALLFGDGIITPAISVMSAIEGLDVATPFFKPFILPLSILVLVVLFFMQKRGTQNIGVVFGPVLFLWFITIGTLGFVQILRCPAILLAINPFYAVNFFFHNGLHGFFMLGYVFLTVTGAEVLYADIGHFGTHPIRQAWYFVVFPALILNYAGQGAYLLHAGSIPPHLFYALCPSWFLLPCVAIATAATVIASQAVISGTFSLFRQAVGLGYWPRIRIIHTSQSRIGQVYLPFVNIMLLVGTLMLILYFKESGKLAVAYGIAVSATMLITTFLSLYLSSTVWRLPRALRIVFYAVIIPVDVAFFIANLIKIPSGGWVVVLIAVAVYVSMTTWIRGRTILRKQVEAAELSLSTFIKDIVLSKPIRVPGVAIFLSGSVSGVPRALLHNFKHNKILHQKTVILAVLIEDIPQVPLGDRMLHKNLGEGIYQVVLRFGFGETANVPEALTLSEIAIPDLIFDPMNTTYFLGKESLITTDAPTMAPWRKKLFQSMAQNSLNASAFFVLPPNRVVELGVQVEL